MKFTIILRMILFLLLFINSITNAQQMLLSLEESLEIGLQNSKELRISEFKITKSEAAANEYSSSMLPKISLRGSYGRLSDVPPFEVNLPILPSPFTLQESYLNNYNLSASIEQPLFTGFRLSSLKSAAEYNRSAEETNYISSRINKANDIELSFWTFYTSKQLVVLVQQNLTALNGNFANTEKLLEEGLVTKNDFLKLKVEIGNMELRLVEAKNNEKLAHASFNKTIGLRFDADTDIITSDINIDPQSEDLNESLSEAEEERQEIKSAEHRLSALEELERAAAADWFPQLIAFGNFYYSNPNPRFLPLEDNFNDSWDVGVSLKWNIWDWGNTSAKAEQIKQDYLITKNNLNLLKENIQLEVYNNYLTLKKALKKIELSLLQLESAEENYRITEQKYYQQLSNSTDLIDAETSLLNAKITLLTAKVEYKIGLSSFNKSLGRKIK